jgi:hypothetical protein
MEKDILIQSIKDRVYENEHNEITGQNLQDTLIDMVNDCYNDISISKKGRNMFHIMDDGLYFGPPFIEVISSIPAGFYSVGDILSEIVFTATCYADNSNIEIVYINIETNLDNQYIEMTPVSEESNVFTYTYQMQENEKFLNVNVYYDSLQGHGTISSNTLTYEILKNIDVYFGKSAYENISSDQLITGEKKEVFIKNDYGNYYFDYVYNNLDNEYIWVALPYLEDINVNYVEYAYYDRVYPVNTENHEHYIVYIFDPKLIGDGHKIRFFLSGSGKYGE